ncbi:MAG: hypothetical protein QOJ35_2046 [Solirubrobacteraceae bacterium]|jgi:hypothetical protein|nr:hypothetical protein [Solirubrobacteraceae bacterium]
MSINRRTIGLAAIAPACLVLALCAATVSAASTSPVARSSASCTPPKYPGAGYFTGKIRVTNVTCTYAKSFVVAYYKCRTHSSLSGRCRSVRRFSCTERRVTIPTEIDARVTCKRGTQRIVHTYQQNLE